MRRWSGVRRAAVLIHCSEPAPAVSAVSTNSMTDPLATPETSFKQPERGPGSRSRPDHRCRLPARKSSYVRRKSPARDMVLTACELLVIAVTICLLTVVTFLGS